MPLGGSGHPEAAPHPARDPNFLISMVAAAASAVVVVTAQDTWNAAVAEPADFATFAALAFALQLVSVEVYGRGAFSFSGAGILAMGFAFGPGPAVFVGVTMGLINMVWRRGRLNRAVFDMSQWALAAGAGAGLFALVDGNGESFGSIGPAFLGGLVFLVINIGLLSLAMSLAEGQPILAVWKERFRWITPYYLTSGPLALALSIAHAQVGIAGLLAFALPPAFMMLSVRQYLARTRQSVDEVRRANEELQRANTQLEARNADLQSLFEFAGGLASRAHDSGELTAYAEAALARMTGATAQIEVGEAEGGIGLLSGGQRVASLHLAQTPGFEGDRWERLREAILPQLATAIESAELVDRVRQKHLETIAALARSMEAKDYYTGGHTERVSDVSVALARRLDYAGTDLDAIEIGALLHDIGKIGIPERILHKPGPLDDEEWKVMKEHPVISEYILSEVDLHPYVTQIARHSHERMDGAGYPDGLVGETIPMPARIVLVADAFDALTSDRPYRRGRSPELAIEEMRAHAGTQFCPRVIAALESIYREEPHILGVARLRAVGGAAEAAA